MRDPRHVLRITGLSLCVYYVQTNFVEFMLLVPKINNKRKIRTFPKIMFLHPQRHSVAEQRVHQAHSGARLVHHLSPCFLWPAQLIRTAPCAFNMRPSLPIPQERSFVA